jgi:hypothetical protein
MTRRQIARKHDSLDANLDESRGPAAANFGWRVE